jgi:hypothetical protein
MQQILPGTHMTIAQAVAAPSQAGEPGIDTLGVMGPAVGPLEFAPNQQVTGTINATGITPQGGQQIPWDDFNKYYNPSQQKQLLKTMGLTDPQITQVQDALQKTEMGQYQQYIYDGTKSIPELQQKSGLAAIIGGISAQQTLTQAQQQQQGGTSPVYSQANLNAYTQGFLLPFIDHVNALVKGDMNEWGSAINKIMAGSGVPSGVTADLKPSAGEAALYQTLAPLMAQQQWTQPYVNMINTMMGQNTAYGAKLAAETAAQQALQGYGVTQPGPNAFPGSGGGLTGGIQGLTAGLTNVNNPVNQNYSPATVPQP